jgi:hypothetical protein
MTAWRIHDEISKTGYDSHMDSTEQSSEGVATRRARPNEAAVLSELALRSKAYWGYSDEFMEQCRAEPNCIGRGIGRTLIEHAKSGVRRRHGTTLLIHGDPHVERFYRAAGGQLIGTIPSESIPARSLPLFRIEP